MIQTYSNYIQSVFQLLITDIFQNFDANTYKTIKKNLQEVFYSLAIFSRIKKNNGVKKMATEILKWFVENISAEYILKILDHSDKRLHLLQAISYLMASTKTQFKTIGVILYSKLCTKKYKEFVM